MRVGIYNRWLATLGGGEKLGLSIAEYISQYHPVTVISHKPVSKDHAAKHLSLDLSRVEFLFIPDRLAPEMTPLSAEYDLFITASFMDYFPCQAPLSAIVIYFPSPIGLEPIMYFRRRLKFALRHWLMIPSFYSGVYDVKSGSLSQIRLVTSTLRVRLPALTHDYQCHFDLASKDDRLEQVVVLLDGEQNGEIKLAHDHSYTRFSLSIPATRGISTHELAILIPEEISSEFPDQVKLTLTNFQLNHFRNRLYRIIFERWLKRFGIHLHYVPPGFYSIIQSIDTYTNIWAISDFSKKWIKKYWDRPSEILSPPINVEDFFPGEKHKKILNVGRFFAGSHNKKHLVMITAFKHMVDEGLQGWELHLVGGTTPGIIHSEYLKKIYQEARDYPIVLHIDILFQDLVKLYSESAIYWHASGFGEDEERDPIKFEHFGITTVEAMASGCVPVVIGRGGQPEIVKHGQNGFLWQNLDELQSYSWKLIQDPDLYKNLSKAALIDSQKYGKAEFNSSLKKLLNNIGVSLV